MQRGKAAVFLCCNSRASIRMPHTNSVGSKAKPGRKRRQALQVRGGWVTVCNWTSVETTRRLHSGWIDNTDLVTRGWAPLEMGSRCLLRGLGNAIKCCSICLCGSPIDLCQALLRLIG